MQLDTSQHGQIEKVSRELPVVVVAGPEGGAYVKTLHKGHRSHTSLRLPSPGKGQKRAQRLIMRSF